MPIGDTNCRCPTGVDLSELVQRCHNCRFEACEMFTHTAAYDATYFESAEAAVADFSEMVDPITAPEVVIFGYRKKRIDRKLYAELPRQILGQLLEEFHEEYGDYKNNYEPCEQMKLAAQDFVDVVLDHYKVWQCEDKPLASKIFKTRRT